MIDRTIPRDAYVRPGPLDEILADLRERGIRPTHLNVIRAAIERGHDDEFAAAIAAKVADDEEIIAPIAMADHMAERRGEYRR